MTTCQCGRPAPNAALCSDCTIYLRGHLEAVPELVRELDITLTRQARLGDRNGSRSADKPLPYDPRASEASWVLRNTLVGWVRILAEESGLDMPKNRAARHAPGLMGDLGHRGAGQDVTTPELAQWLAGYVHHLAQHVAGSEALEEIRSAVDQARRAVDQPANRARIPIGPCPEPDCTGAIVAYIPTSQDRPATMNCGHGHTWDTIHWRSIGRRVLAARAS